VSQQHRGSLVRLATRGSPLALSQTEAIAEALRSCHPGLETEVVVVSTTGDQRAAEPLRVLGGQGIFVKEVQQAVLEGFAEVAVHSAKDLPSATPPGLEIACVPKRADPADALVGRALAGLGPGATVATGSPRRQALLRSLRPDLNLVELRGNMARRFAAVGSDGIDAVVTAMAALDRLGRLELVAERLEPEIFTPQVGQGALAVEAMAGSEAATLLGALDDPSSHRCLTAERSFLLGIGAGCLVPAGAWCTEEEGVLTLRSVMAGADGTLKRSELHGTDAALLGQSAAHALGGGHSSS
jgi:hydroxymethylbilane synthase